MSTIAICPTCGSKSKIKEENSLAVFQSLQDDELIKKVGQLKKAMEKFKEKAVALEKELIALKK